jgi:hypothetical protein
VIDAYRSWRDGYADRQAPADDPWSREDGRHVAWVMGRQNASVEAF